MSTWEEAVRRYELLDILAEACAEFGEPTALEFQMDRTRRDAIAEHGTLENAKRVPGWSTRLDDAWNSVKAAEERASDLYFGPAEDAAIALINIAAPTPVALRFKVEAIKKRELWNHRHVVGDCFAIIEADARRLLGEVA